MEIGAGFQVSGTSLQLTADSCQLVACRDDYLFRISFSCQLPVARCSLSFSLCSMPSALVSHLFRRLLVGLINPS